MSRKAKIGDGHASAMGRQGLNELRAALYTDSNVAQRPEYGLYGTRTQGEIADDRKVDEHDRDGDSLQGPTLDDRSQELEQQRDERDDEVELELER